MDTTTDHFTPLALRVRGNNCQCFRCPCLVMDERPRSDVSDKQLQVSTQYQEQKFFFEIKVAIAKVAPYAVFVGKRISGFRC